MVFILTVWKLTSSTLSTIHQTLLWCSLEPLRSGPPHFLSWSDFFYCTVWAPKLPSFKPDTHSSHWKTHMTYFYLYLDEFLLRHKLLWSCVQLPMCSVMREFWHWVRRHHLNTILRRLRHPRIYSQCELHQAGAGEILNWKAYVFVLPF